MALLVGGPGLAPLDPPKSGPVNPTMRYYFFIIISFSIYMNLHSL